MISQTLPILRSIFAFKGTLGRLAFDEALLCARQAFILRLARFRRLQGLPTR